MPTKNKKKFDNCFDYVQDSEQMHKREVNYMTDIWTTSERCLYRRAAEAHVFRANAQWSQVQLPLQTAG